MDTEDTALPLDASDMRDEPSSSWRLKDPNWQQAYGEGSSWSESQDSEAGLRDNGRGQQQG